MRVIRKILLLTALALAPLPAFAQACVGFTDVQQTDFFCDEVEWMKNRGVTLGCTATAYCPNDSVTRAQMALFMTRLGRVLSPVILRATDAVVQSAFNPPVVMCNTATVASASHLRQASFTAAIMNFNATAQKTMQGQLVYTTSVPPPADPLLWTPTGDSVMWQTVDPAERTTFALTGGPLQLAAGQSYTFGIRMSTNNIAALVDAECQLNARIDNANEPPAP